jgi:long-subunit fatty acid transport protein
MDLSLKLLGGNKMIKYRKYFIPLIASLLIGVVPLHGQGIKKVAQAGMSWLTIPVGARGAALGNAYLAVANDASSAFWNPAGLAYAEGIRAFVTQTQWIADINVNAGVLSYNAGGYGVFGLHFLSVDWGTINGTRRADNDQGYIDTGTFSPTDWLVGISYARQISNSFSIGANLRYIYESLGSTFIGSMDSPTSYKAEMDLLSFDFGTTYYTGYKDLRLSMTLQNFSKEPRYVAEYFSLPLTFKFGMAMDVSKFWGESTDHSLTLALDAVHPRDYTERVHVGAEYSFRDMVFLRGGYKSNYDEQDLSLGGGVHYAFGEIALGLDYSYVMFTNFDAVHMFSFDFIFK